VERRRPAGSNSPEQSQADFPTTSRRQSGLRLAPRTSLSHTPHPSHESHKPNSPSRFRSLRLVIGLPVRPASLMVARGCNPPRHIYTSAEEFYRFPLPTVVEQAHLI